MKIDVSKSYQNFAAGFVPWTGLSPEWIVPSNFLRLMDVMAILFCTIPGIYMVNLDRLFFVGLGKIVFWKALDMTKTKIVKPSEYAVDTMIWREQMMAAGAYDTMKSHPSIIDDLSANVLE